MADLGDLAVRLASLESDLGLGDLAGPLAARDRARQRIWRHRAGTVVVVAAAAIGVIASPLEVWSGPGSDAGPPASSPTASPETNTATARLCGPAGGGCVDNPELEPEVPEAEYAATRQLLFEVAQRHFDPDGEHLGFESQGGTSSRDPDGAAVYVGAKLDWTNADKPGTGLVNVSVSTPDADDVGDIALNQGCKDLGSDCTEAPIPSTNETAWVAGSDDATGRQFAIIYTRQDGVIVTVAVYNLFGNNSVEAVSDIDIDLERGFAFVQDPGLEVHPDDSPRE